MLKKSTQFLVYWEFTSWTDTEAFLYLLRFLWFFVDDLYVWHDVYLYVLNYHSWLEGEQLEHGIISY